MHNDRKSYNIYKILNIIQWIYLLWALYYLINMQDFMVAFDSSVKLSSGLTSTRDSFVEESYDAVLSTPIIVISTSTISGEDLSLAKFQDYHYGQEMSFESKSSISHYKLSLVEAKFNSHAGSTISMNQEIQKPRKESSGICGCFCFRNR